MYACACDHLFHFIAALLSGWRLCLLVLEVLGKPKKLRTVELTPTKVIRRRCGVCLRYYDAVKQVFELIFSLPQLPVKTALAQTHIAINFNYVRCLYVTIVTKYSAPTTDYKFIYSVRYCVMYKFALRRHNVWERYWKWLNLLGWD